jgi:hypothetical protein
MPIYGDIEAVKRMLRPTDDSVFGDDEDARLEEIQQAVSSAIERKLRRSFGVPAVDTTKLVWGGPFDTLILPVPARSITSVTWNPIIAGGVATGGQVFTSDRYAYDPQDSRTGEIMGLRLLSGLWGWRGPHGRPAVPVQIIGDFVDSDDDATVPDEITYAVNYLIAETFKNQNAGPGGGIGPDGNVIYPRNPWKDTLVVTALEKHQSANYPALF